MTETESKSATTETPKKNLEAKRFKVDGKVEDDGDSEDSMPLKKLAAMKKRGKGTPATKVTMGRKISTPVQSTPEADNNLDFDEEMEDTKVVKSPSVKVKNEKPTPAKKPTTAKKKDKWKEKISGMLSTKEEKVKPKKVTREKKTNNDAASPSSDGEKNPEEEDLAACCLCHCALDYSDRSAFFEADRKQEVEIKTSASDDDPAYFQPTDPFLPHDIYDPSNALVYCDTCDRLYHQKCHFVPLMVLPRGKWSCLVCTTKGRLTNARSPLQGRKQNNVEPKKEPAPAAPFTKNKLSRMFKSPLPPSKLQQYEASNGKNEYHSPAEMEWEIATGRDKAILWNKTLTQTIPTWIQSQMSNLSQARMALETLTQTKQNRQHFLENKASKRGSQELAQTLVKLAGAKWKMRQMVLNLEEIRANPERHIQLLHQWCQRVKGENVTAAAIATTSTTTVSSLPPPKSFIERVIFPFGQYPSRTIPRTPEMKEEMEQHEKDHVGGVPPAIVTTETAAAPNAASANGKLGAESSKNIKNQSQKALSPRAKESDDDCNSTGVSLDDLVCAVCMKGDASDDNDLLLCDAQGCFRAYHMQCLEPAVTLKEVEDTEGEDWFCPLCSGMARCVHRIQSYYMGEEWDRRRLERAAAVQKAKSSGKKKKPDDKRVENNGDDEEDEDDDDNDSLKSWEKPTDVFPESKWEYETALELKAGKQNDATDALLRDALGEGQEEHEGNLVDICDETDDEELDAHFDLDAFHEERKREYEEMEEDGSVDDTTHSSQATLVDMSSVELKIGKDELNCLSDGTGLDSDDNSASGSDDEGGSKRSDSERDGRRRRSRRLRKRQNQVELPKRVSLEFDPNNIVQGKRRRKPVDYRKLNDAMFGGLDAEENAKLDDKEDFSIALPKKNGRAFSGDGGSNDDGIDSDSGNEGSDLEQTDVAGKKNGKYGKGSRKRRRSLSDEDTESGNEAENDDSSMEPNGKKKKAVRVPPPKKKHRVSRNGKKTTSAAKVKTTKIVTKATIAKKAKGKKSPNKQNGKKTSTAATNIDETKASKKPNGAKAAGGTRKKKKAPKVKGTAAANSKK